MRLLRNNWLLLSICSFCMTLGSAQADSIQIADVVERFFNAMKVSDSSAMSAELHPDISLETVVEGEIKATNIVSFLQSVAQSPLGSLDERYEIVSIRHDDNLGYAWMEYEFFYEGKYLHKGHNLFVLVKVSDNWLVYKIVDTRVR